MIINIQLHRAAANDVFAALSVFWFSFFFSVPNELQVKKLEELLGAPAIPFLAKCIRPVCSLCVEHPKLKREAHSFSQELDNLK